MSEIIKKLPTVFQTTAEKKFFDATFDQVFSKKDSEYLAGYLGRKVPGQYNPVTDFYIPEPTKNRSQWQLEPTVYARDKNYNKTNILFYEDLLNRIDYYGGNTLNQNRLFDSEFYSWAPPIDFDMFINYQNYYWVGEELQTITIENVTCEDIVGKTEFKIPGTDVYLSTGMIISLPDDTVCGYVDPHYVEFVDGKIVLIKWYKDVSNNGYQFLPWDGVITTESGLSIINKEWDTKHWEIEARLGKADYVTINRGSLDKNAWSRSNRWVHIDTIRQVMAITGSGWPSSAVRAARPIIQYDSNIELYKSGVSFFADVNYGFIKNADGTSVTLADVQLRSLTYLNTEYGIDIDSGDLVAFLDVALTEDQWQGTDYGSTELVNYVFEATVTMSGDVLFTPLNGWNDPVSDGDIIYTIENVLNGAGPGESWFNDQSGGWTYSANNKSGNNSALLFQLYDHEGVKLDDSAKYPESNFGGSRIFSYMVNTVPGATVDPVLGFPIVYSSNGQSSDIMFENNLITDRYVYSKTLDSIGGYYYYRVIGDPVHKNGWELYTRDNTSITGARLPTPRESRQRVIDKFVVKSDSEYQFRLSVDPVSLTSTEYDIKVSVNSNILSANQYYIEDINGKLYINLNEYLSTQIFNKSVSVLPVVEISTFTKDYLENTEYGYFEIPQQLEANPTQQEVGQISGSDLIQHFSSIISSQPGFVGTAFGGSNNYRDTVKNKSLGSHILQNAAPMLKSMLMSSDTDLDLVAGIRYAQDEYTKFKNRYISTAFSLIKQEFDPVQYFNNTVLVGQWVDEILKTINVSKEFSKSFAYSYMVASGTPTEIETKIIDDTHVMLDFFINLADEKNAMYIYDVADNERLLLIDIDYKIVSTNNLIEVELLDSGLVGKELSFVFFDNPVPSYIPSTPSKLGANNVYIPKIEIDYSYATPAEVLIGHDGSKTITYGDYRDQLLLELEKRIYNSIKSKYRNDHILPLRLESVRSGFFRQVDYTYYEYVDIAEQYLNKWCARNRANYRANDWDRLKNDVPVDQLWKLYNYSRAEDINDNILNLPGHWKGIFSYLYDTHYPDTKPWEMLGFSDMPEWWVDIYGPGIANSNGQTVWTNPAMWSDLEQGIIRAGARAVINPYNNAILPNKIWARPGLSQFMPIDSSGNLRSVIDIFNIKTTTNPYEPFDGYNDEWKFGDGSPVEQAWMASSSYAYCIQEILFLTKPAQYCEFFWDTNGVEFSIGRVQNQQYPDYGRALSYFNYQIVQNDAYPADNELVHWMRPKNSSQYVHGELVDGEVQVRYGYQQWISDKILFHGKDLTEVFGVKIRTTDVNLGNKFAGFTNKDTVNTYIESISLQSNTRSLGVPSDNFDVFLHKGQPLNSYSYSGVIIRALDDGTFAIYGYDLLNSQFETLDRSDNKAIDVTVGGTPAEFTYFTVGATYNQGDIVRYNGIYYSSKVSHVAVIFDDDVWQRLPALPIIGGVSVSYKPYSLDTVTRYAYGSILKTPQAVFDFLIGWGAYLEKNGWKFDEVHPETNQVSDWLYSAKQFLFWLNSSWAPNATIQLSPLATKATLVVERGYPNDVELISNGVYSILDKSGVAIPTEKTVTERDGRLITVMPADLSAGGIYFLQVNSSESEHVILFDNATSFGDVIYSPLLRTRQDRIRFNGFRSKNWYGKMEAPGYLIMDNRLVPNYDTLVSDIRHYYDPDTIIDSPNMEELGRRLIGFENKDYLDNLQVSDDVQYLFYQGAIREKGTKQSLNKLFRSTNINTNETITVFEEWALKTGNIGNIVEQVSTEFIIDPEQYTGDTMVAKLNFVPSDIGSVKQINLLNAVNRYKTVPKIEIDLPDANPLEGKTVYQFVPGNTYQIGDIIIITSATGETAYYRSIILQTPSEFVPANWEKLQTIRPAKAFAVLDKQGRISRIDMADHGFGYLSTPDVRIVSDEVFDQEDTAYAVWQGESLVDQNSDNIISIDIDDSEKWVYRPFEPGNALEFPVTTQTEFGIPNAGYVHLEDVTWNSFDVLNAVLNWGVDNFNPALNDSIWIAKTFTQDWGVYKLASYNRWWKVVKDTNGDLLLLTETSELLGDQGSVFRQKTDLGNLIAFQRVEKEGVVPETNYAVCFDPEKITYIDPDTTTVYNAYRIVNLNNVPLTVSEIGNYEEFNTLILFKTLRWLNKPAHYQIPIYVGLGDYIWVDDVDGKWSVFKTDIDPGRWDIYQWGPEVPEFYGVGVSGRSVHAYGWDTEGPMRLEIHRQQEPLINTALFKNASVFAGKSGNTLIQLPVYDPFKGIFPGIAMQNITYMSVSDPAKYNITTDPKLYTDYVSFLDNEVGKLWWDLSSVRYMYYEQPASQSGSESLLDNLRYRRDNWGRLFPGSSVDIYEWVKSPVTPAEYTGPGTPKDTESFIQINKTNIFNGITSSVYYFWVKNGTDKPGIENRTLSAQQVATMLQSPRVQGYSFFSPIQQSSDSNSYMFYNVQDILSSKGRNVRVEYQQSDRDDQKHTQWSLFREDDISSDVKDIYWNKFVDSICGYTEVITSAQMPKPAIPVTGGFIMPVPDPRLSEYEKYGINTRPIQSMFVDIYSARKILVQSLNDLLKSIPARDKRTGWDDGLSNDYWEYTTWYKAGYENVRPNKTRNTLSEAYQSLIDGDFEEGDIVEILQSNLLDNTVRYALYAVVSNGVLLSFEEIAIQDSAISLLDSIYTTKNEYSLSLELRNLLTALKDNVFVDDYYIYRNRLFGSMLNYVLSEQKTPDWIFKTSLITVKEGTVSLTQDRTYVPNQVEDIIDYITDSKPYHTHIRDYTTVYGLMDVANMSASDSMKSVITLTFNPGVSIFTPDNWDMFAWDTYGWEKVHDEKVYDEVVVNGQTYNSLSGMFGTNPLLTTDVGTILDANDAYQIPISVYDESKKGYSSLYPYTFSTADGTTILPAEVIGILDDGKVLYQGIDFYVESNNDNTYTAYLYNSPTGNNLSAIVWINGGNLQLLTHPVYRSEYAFGYPIDNNLIVVDTKMPIALVDGEYVPLIGWGSHWSSIDPDSTLSKIIREKNGLDYPYDILDENDPTNIKWDYSYESREHEIVLLDETASFMQSTVSGELDQYYRISEVTTGELVTDIPALGRENELDPYDVNNLNLQAIQVYAESDILPEPGLTPGAVWIQGERIEYREKVYIGDNIWELRLVRRGTRKTSEGKHYSETTSKLGQGTVPTAVFVEEGNRLPESTSKTSWNSVGNQQDAMISSIDDTGVYTSIANPSAGGMWYAGNSAAQFVTDKPGTGIR